MLLLPLLVMILLTEAQLGVVAADTPGQLFGGGTLSNRQLQVAALLTAGWACLLAWKTRTSALASVFTAAAALLWVALLTDLGLGDWVREGRWGLLSFHLLPLVPLLGIGGRVTEVRGLTWFGRPLVLGCAVVFVLALELLAQQGRQLDYLGLSLAGLANTGTALLLLSHHREWFDRPWWAVLVITTGILALVLGLLLDVWSRVLRRTPRP